MVCYQHYTIRHACTYFVYWTVIQLAKLSGFSPIITTATKSNEAYLQSLGATHIIDRAVVLSQLAEAIKSITATPVKVAYDAISLFETQNAVYDVLAPGGQLVTVLSSAIAQEKLRTGRDVVHVIGNVHLPDQRELGKSLYAKLTELLTAGDIKVRSLVRFVRGSHPDGVLHSRTTWRCCRTG